MKRGGYIKRKVKLLEEAERKEDLWPFYMSIWKERPHVSEISGKPLGNSPRSYMFDHLLEQNKYPELRMVKENIILCTFAEHEAKTLGHPLPKHEQLIEQARKKLITHGKF